MIGVLTVVVWHCRCAFGLLRAGDGGRREQACDWNSDLTPTPPTTAMPTELPYAADAEDSLSYDELEVQRR